jgi:hypothetical protein
LKINIKMDGGEVIFTMVSSVNRIAIVQAS